MTKEKHTLEFDANRRIEIPFRFQRKQVPHMSWTHFAAISRITSEFKIERSSKWNTCTSLLAETRTKVENTTR